MHFVTFVLFIVFILQVNYVMNNCNVCSLYAIAGFFGNFILPLGFLSELVSRTFKKLTTSARLDCSTSGTWAHPWIVHCFFIVSLAIHIIIIPQVTYDYQYLYISVGLSLPTWIATYLICNGLRQLVRHEVERSGDLLGSSNGKNEKENLENNADETPSDLEQLLNRMAENHACVAAAQRYYKESSSAVSRASHEWSQKCLYTMGHVFDNMGKSMITKAAEMNSSDPPPYEVAVDSENQHGGQGHQTQPSSTDGTAAGTANNSSVFGATGPIPKEIGTEGSFVNPPSRVVVKVPEERLHAPVYSEGASVTTMAG